MFLYFLSLLSSSHTALALGGRAQEQRVERVAYLFICNGFFLLHVFQVVKDNFFAIGVLLSVLPS